MERCAVPHYWFMSLRYLMITNSDAEENDKWGVMCDT